MATVKVRAIVIKDQEVGESNKILTLFAKDFGKMTVSAKGAKNQKSKFLSGSQVFCYSDFMLYEGSGFFAVTQIDLIENFAIYYRDIFKLTYSAYFLELIDKTVMFSQESNDIMLLLLKSLQIMGQTDNPKKISAAFQIKLFDYLGFCPDTFECSVCAQNLINGDLFFSEANYFVCGNCRESGAVPVSASIIDAIRFFSGSDLSRAFMFKMAESVINELHRISEVIVKNQLEITTNSLRLIKNF